MAIDLTPPTLTGEHVQLVPLSADHRDGLIEAVRDGQIYRLWYTHAPSPEGMAAEIERRLGLQRAGSMIPFTVVSPADGAIVGMTTYMAIDAETPRLEIGFTWHAKRVQRSGLNTEAKLVLLTYAFETLGCIAVEFRTHFLNHQSRRAIERLGAKLDGILRNHMRGRDGTLRDTAVYSVIAAEWPAIRTHLTWLLERPR